MTSRSRALILGFALLGLAFAASSTWVHYKILTDATYTSPCDINSTFNCSQVYLSPYGSIGGIPVAIGGLFWFALVAVVAALSSTGKEKPGGSYIFLLSVVGLAAVLYLGYTSFVTLKTGCVLCIGTYVAVVAIFLISGATRSIPLAQVPGRLFQDLLASLRKPAAAAAALLVVGGTGAVVAYFPKEGTRPQAPGKPIESTTDFAEAWSKQPRIDLGIPADGAKVIIVKFNDFQCPSCRITHEWYQPVLDKFEQSNPGAVKYVLKDWPWNTKCNSSGQTLHPGACEAAVAVRIARSQGKDKEHEMEEWLFAHQQPPASAEEVKASAQKILGITDFDQQYQQKLPDIRRDVADGVALGVNGTPTFFINGVRIFQTMPPAYFELAIQLELNRAAGK
jgi:uncharacterized membrane protein/protein-disulfide isomerase